MSSHDTEEYKELKRAVDAVSREATPEMKAMVARSFGEPEPKPLTGYDVFKSWHASDTLIVQHDGTPPVTLKETNPKDAVGVRKVPFSTVPAPVMAEVGLGMLEGGRKYGRHNYRVVGVLASVYYDASMRHMMDWWEGEDLDPDSGLSHVTKAIASLVVLRDAMMKGKMVDDRPPKSAQGWMKALNKLAGKIIDRYPDAKPPHTEKPL